jgi:glycerol-3-phosphate dehydrogenase (NAD(P)+)
MQRIGIIGGGAWGSALALTARRAGRDVMLWAREAEVAAAINRDHVNPLFLPGVALDPGITATLDLGEAARGVDALLLVTPAQHLRTLVTALASHVPARLPLVICVKGIEEQSGALMSDVVQELLPEAPLAVVTLASADRALGERLIVALGTRSFRPYLAEDLVGAQIGGAIKNVLAIACGIVTGRALGDNARAALITRGLAEMVRLARAKGGQAETLMGLSGLGDLVLTCTGLQSRNHSLGVALGEGRALAEILAERRSVAEGVTSAAAAAALARRLGVDMPITAAVDAILHHDAAIDGAVAGLLARPFKSEAGG